MTYVKLPKPNFSIISETSVKNISLKDVGMTMLKVQEQDAVYAGKTSDDGMRNKEQHEGKGKGWACNNHDMRNLIKRYAGRGYTCYNAHLLPLPSCCYLMNEIFFTL